MDEDRSDSYSGPTVVDDAKIAESLKRLRSLDLPLNALPGTLIGISVPALDAVTTPVLDPPSSETTRIDDRPASALVSPLGRPTAVGHNVGPQVITHQAPPQLDPMRGTMFGHSVHLPDVDAPEPSADDNSSGRLVVPRPTAEEIKPFLPDRTTRPAHQRDAQPAKPPLAATQVINVAQPFKRELFHEPESKSTEVVTGMRQRVRGRTAFMVVAIASAAGVAFAWMYSRETNITLTLPPANPAAAIPTATQVLAPRPLAPPKETTPPTVPPQAVGETARLAAPSTLVPPAATESAAREVSRPVIDTGKPATSRRERHRAATAAETSVAPLLETPPEAKPAEAKTEPKPFEAGAAEAKVAEPKAAEPKVGEPVEAKVEAKAELKPETKVGTKAGKGKKRGDAEEDPDATMAPSD